MQYDDVEGIKPIDGVVDLLAFLDEQSWPWAIYTSADAKLARVRLAAAGVTPQVLVTRDQVANGKPAPDGYLRAADALDIPADGCIVVEDTDVGRRVVEAWVENQVPQCGYCQSGQVLAATALLSETPNPTDEDVEAAMSNLCRCGTYNKIRDAVRSASEA